MKNPDPYLKLHDAQEKFKNTYWPGCPTSFVRTGVTLYRTSKGKEGIHFIKSSVGARAHISVKMSDVIAYFNRVQKIAA